MKLFIRRKIASPVQVPAPLPAVVGSDLPQPLWHSVAELARSLSDCARADGLESGDVLVEVEGSGL